MAVELARMLQRQGLRSSVYATDMDAPARTQQGAPLKLPTGAEGANVTLFRARWPYSFAFAPTLFSALRREVRKFSVVHVHSLYLFPQFAAYRAARASDVPYVVTQHGTLDPHLRARGRWRKQLVDMLYQRRLLERAALIHVGTSEEGRGIADIAPTTPRACAPFGIHWGDFAELPAPSQFRNRFLNGHTGPVIMNTGRLARKKGLDILVRAFAILARERQDAMLALVGPAEEGLRHELAELATTLGVGDRTVFPGLLDAKDVRAALAAADIWALPSRADAFPMAVLEALAAGCVVVLSPAVNTAPEISNAGAGVVRDADERSFADVFAKLLNEPDRRETLKRNARTLASRYDWDAIAPMWIELYRRASVGIR